jgi:peroxiredoxin Q/BCP
MTSDTTLTIGQPAPTFTLPATGGQTVRLEDFHGKQSVVLYFYPKDDTPGCTKEACAFRDLSSDFARAGAVILGVSTDPVDSHEAFAAKYSLGFPLLADTDAQVSRAYGAYGPKSSSGRQYEGVLRTTFVIDREGVLRKIYPDVKVDQHAEEVLSFLGTL